MSEEPTKGSNTEKDPDEWTTGEEPMTGAQASYLKTLSEQAGESFDHDLTKAEASKRIDELQRRTGRGTDDERAPQLPGAGTQATDHDPTTEADEASPEAPGPGDSEAAAPGPDIAPDPT